MANTLKGKRINKIIYFSLGGAILSIVIFLIVFNIFTGNGNLDDNIETGKDMASNENTSQEASSSIGKNVEELSKYEELKDEGELQVDLAEAENSKEENKAEATNSDNAVANTGDNGISTQPSETDVADINTIAELAEANTALVDAKVEEAEEIKDPIFIMPVDGEIVKHYGKDKLIYSDTLKEWTTHLGIDIKADKTTIVKTSSDGIVKSIKNDPRYGLTVVVEHQNGFSSVYANLLTAEFVVVGEEVKAGQTLGTVGNSATFEILDDPHLHFEIMKDGNSIDPEMYIK